MEKSVFNEMAKFVEILVVRSLHGSVFFWRDDGFHPLIFRLIQNRVGIVSLVGHQIIGSHPFDQASSVRTIRVGTLSDKDSDRHTMRIHGQMDLGVKPPLVRLIS